MRVVFVSNYYNHHQKPFCDEMYRLLGDEFYFIETREMSEERRRLGYTSGDKLSYVVQNYKEEYMRYKCQELIDEADIVIHGSCPYELIQKRLKQEKITFEYSERIYKKPCKKYKLPRYIWLHYFKYGRYKNYYLLCASGFAYADFMKTFAFRNRAYMWGYFPEFIPYEDIQTVIRGKTKNSILWAARFLDWKHPELVVEVAKRLRDDGYSFLIHMIGNGIMEEEIRTMICQKNLESHFCLDGAMPPSKVRKYMDNSEIFIATSDRNEGWGAVVNEAMNSACAVVASSAMGAVPVLIENGVNGYIFQDGDVEDLYKKVKQLLDNLDLRTRIAKKAYETIKDEWNARVAADRLIHLIKRMLHMDKNNYPYDTGVLSKAVKIADNWFKGEDFEIRHK